MSLMQFEVASSDSDAHPYRERKATLLKRLAKLVNPYRPYKHYMRGPGPRCRQKTAGGGGRQ
jgi:hypothetical protein